MGKRKRTGTSAADYHPSPSDSMPCSSGRDLIPVENSSDPDNITIFEPHHSGKEIMDTHGKQPNSQLSLSKHHQNLGRSMFLKRSRHHYGNQYSRRNSSNYHKPSAFYGNKSSPFQDEQLCFKLGSKYKSDLGHRPDFADLRERAAFWQPERIRSSSAFIHAVSAEGAKMACGKCQKSLRRKSHQLGSTPSPDELSIVAVLVCGHLFHAECLDQTTRLEDKRDPPCPMCSEEFVPKAEANLN